MNPRRDTPGHSLAPPMTGLGAASLLTTAVGQPAASDTPRGWCLTPRLLRRRSLPRLAPSGLSRDQRSPHSLGALPSCWAAAGLLPYRAPWPGRPCWEADTLADRARSRGAQCVRG